MSSYCLSVRFLTPFFHGRSDSGAEWPPSPVRVFQALVAAAGRKHPDGVPSEVRNSLQLLSSAPPPFIIAPARAASTGYVLSVPNNSRDASVAALVKGNEQAMSTHRTMKLVRPSVMDSRLEANGLGDLAAVHYVWPIPGQEFDQHAFDILNDLAARITALGWGIDMAVGNGAIIDDHLLNQLEGERWEPGSARDSEGLRTLTPETLNELIARHEKSLMRLSDNSRLDPPPPFVAFNKTAYQRATDGVSCTYVAFALRPIGDEGRRFRTFDTARQGLRVSGMMRHAAKHAALASLWDERDVASFILGHAESENEPHLAPGASRVSFLPLPTIQMRGHRIGPVGAINRVLISTASPNGAALLRSLANVLSGEVLIDEDTARAVAVLDPHADSVVSFYTRHSIVWESVTPVILPGFDDPRNLRRGLGKTHDFSLTQNRIEKLKRRGASLVRKAMRQAGFSAELAENAHIEFRKTGFWPGTLPSDRYGAPDHLKRFPRYHVRIEWRDARHNPVAVPGPISIGSGRFYGLGLFASAPG